MRGLADFRSSILRAFPVSIKSEWAVLVVSAGIDEHLRFNAFEWRDCQKRLCKTSSKARNHSLWARNLAIFVLEEGLEEVKGDKT